VKKMPDPPPIDSSPSNAPSADPRRAEPVEYPTGFIDSDASGPRPGIGICLSGGGYRAMLFHLGSLWRLNELGVLGRTSRISSVSGGSITAAAAGLAWREMDWRDGVAANFGDRVVAPVRELASRTIDVGSVLGGAVLPRVRAGDRVAAAYRKHLLGDATLQDLPDDRNGAPRFVINATSVQTGTLWRFSRRYLANWRVGRADEPNLSLATAVAASSAFPPVLSPVIVRFRPGYLKPIAGADLHREPYTTSLVLTDGGVYDNLGLETVWKRLETVLVSDGGGQMEDQPSPARDPLRHSYRINGLIDNQVRALRKRQVVDSFIEGRRGGAYWRSRSNIADFPVAGTLPCPHPRTLGLAAVPTRLKAMEALTQERLINWGYAAADAAVRAHLLPDAPAPDDFPYPASAV
jgi:NTE family protein